MQAGPEPRDGVSVFEQTDTYYDGGFRSSGNLQTSNLMGFGTYFRVKGTQSEPNALWKLNSIRSTYTDHACMLGGGGNFGAVPPSRPRMDLNFEDLSIADSVTTWPPVSRPTDSVFMQVSTTSVARVTGASLTRNGHPDSSAIGAGGVQLVNEAQEGTASAEFVSCEWIGNTAGSSPAVSAAMGLRNTGFHHCLFRYAHTSVSSSAPFINKPLVRSFAGPTLRIDMRGRSPFKQPRAQL
eukprot:COSAG04_NODE_476_length_13722_cov_16.614707_2_plen_239_part_00